MNGFEAWLAQLDFDRIWMMALTLLSGVLCITVHESCHGLAALAWVTGRRRIWAGSA